MASSALEEKINKIRLQNEEIKRRYEEVEADKKNAAKFNALVQLVPSDDWPERKEPPEFSAPVKNNPKQKNPNKEHVERPQRYSGVQDRLVKKDHKFNQRDGPPPDPKYNFLADSEREMRTTDDDKVEDEKNRARKQSNRGSTRRRGGGVGGNEGRGGGSGGPREAYFKDNRGPHAFHSKEESLPEYEAWRAERNRIDEARINRQKTAEGNWRREWDNNKVNVEKDGSRKSDSRKDSNNYERRNNYYDSDYSSRGHGGTRTYHGSQKNHGHQDYRRSHHDQPHENKRRDNNPPLNKPPLSPTDDRYVNATDKSLKVTVNPANQSKGPVMSVKVNSPSIAGTGRVGPRQKSRVTYSSQSDAEMTTHEINSFSRQKSFDEKTAAANFNSGQKVAPKSPYSQRKKEGNSKSPYPQRKEFKNDDSLSRPKTSSKTPQRNELREKRQSINSASKPQRTQKRVQKTDADDAEMFAEDAIPSEYNPVKPLPEEFNELKMINNDLNKTNETDERFSDTLKNLGDSINNLEPTTNIDSEVQNVNEGIDENSENDKSHLLISNAGLENSEDNDNYENFSLESEQKNVQEIKVEEKIINENDLCANIQENLVETTLNEVVLTTNLEKIDMNENESNLNKEILDTKSIEKEQERHLCTNNVYEEISEQQVLDEKNQEEIEKSSRIEIMEDQKNILEKPKEIEIDIMEDEKDEVEKNEKIEINKNQEKILEKNENIEINENQEKILEKSETIEINENQKNILEKRDEIEIKKDQINVLEKYEKIQINQDQENILEKSNKIEIIENQTNVLDKCEKIEINEDQKDILEKSDKIEIMEDQKNILEKSNKIEIIENQTNVLDKCEKIEINEDQKDILEKSDKIEIIEDEKNVLEKSITDESHPTIDEVTAETEAVKCIDNSTNKLIELQENIITDSEISLNKSINDSGFIDNNLTNESIELDETKLTYTDDSQEKSLIDESNKLEQNSDNPSFKFDHENNPEKKYEETVKSNLVDVTKEICEKTEICDIHSAASTETSEILKDQANKSENKEEVSKILENIAKDSDIKVNEFHESSSKNIDVQNITSKESVAEENAVKEESMKVVTEESKKD